LHESFLCLSLRNINQIHMLLTEVKIMAENLMFQHGLKQSGWTFQFDNAINRCGCCRYRIKKIQVSKHYASLNNEAIVKDTILHEIAHALVGPGHGHDHVWKAKAIEIGCSGFRCKSEDTHEGFVRTPSRYIATCHSCKNNTFRNRVPKYRVSCARCSNRFDPNLVLTFTSNIYKLIN